MRKAESAVRLKCWKFLFSHFFIMRLVFTLKKFVCSSPFDENLLPFEVCIVVAWCQIWRIVRVRDYFEVHFIQLCHSNNHFVARCILSWLKTICDICILDRFSLIMMCIICYWLFYSSQDNRWTKFVENPKKRMPANIWDYWRFGRISQGADHSADCRFDSGLKQWIQV